MSTLHHRLTRAAAGALVVGAVAAPAANALPAEMIDGSYRPAPAAESLSAAKDPVRAPAPTVTRTIDDGFDLGSAAIGAGGAAALLLVAGTGVSALSQRKRRVGVVS
jgi:hypothetical protein